MNYKNFKIIKCWDVGFAIYNNKTHGYLGWHGEWDRSEDDKEREMVQLFDTEREAKTFIDNIGKTHCDMCESEEDLATSTVFCTRCKQKHNLCEDCKSEGHGIDEENGEKRAFENYKFEDCK